MYNIVGLNSRGSNSGGENRLLSQMNTKFNEQVKFNHNQLLNNQNPFDEDAYYNNSIAIGEENQYLEGGMEASEIADFRASQPQGTDANIS